MQTIKSLFHSAKVDLAGTLQNSQASEEGQLIQGKFKLSSVPSMWEFMGDDAPTPAPAPSALPIVPDNPPHAC